jgi:hypothetical protein
LEKTGIKMNMKLLTNAILVASTFGFAGISNASMYYLESNNLSESGNLASVTLTDNGSNVDITVTALYPSLQVAGFGFNLASNPGSISCSSLPANYSCNAGSFQYDGSGNYTDQADPSNFGAANRSSSFSFTLLGFNEADFIANIPQGNLFATHVYLESGATGFAFGGTVVPVPAAVWLFGSGLLGLAGVARRRKS